jgi:periplasmic mercuric ion binding protein
MKSIAILLRVFLMAGAAMAKEATTEIKVSGMTCQACAVSVQKSLEKVKGVKRAEVSSDKGLATVVYDDAQANEQQLRDAINKTGFKAQPATGQK